MPPLTEGMHVILQGVDDVPNGTCGVVEFVDDLGFVFIETPADVRNVVLSPIEAPIHANFYFKK